jgi:membrane-bound lytic murein transglycosylase D
MKPLSNFLAIIFMVLLFGYITFNEMRRKPHPSKTTISDAEVADLAYPVEDLPLPAISFDVPTNVSFAGEPVPMNIPDVRERLDKELQMNSYFHSNTIFLIKRANRWLPQMEKILKAHGIPEDFKYLPLIESNLMNAVSPAEAVGYWQILKDSGKELGLEITKEVDERYDPLKATEAACKYLKKAKERFGNWTLVAASYNRGMSGLDRAIENQKETSYYDLFLNDETSRYVFRLLAIKEIINNPAKYGFKVNPKHYYQEEPLKYVEVTESIKSLVEFAKQNGTNYKLLKRHNPWLRDEQLTVKKGKRYKIAIPA